MTDKVETQKKLDLSAEEKELEEICKSLERSRKRHLSVGLLRGDQAADRLAEQEGSASPLLKKTKTMAITMKEFEAYMDRNVNKRLDSIDEGQAKISDEINRVKETVGTHAKLIDSNSKATERNKTSIAEIREELRSMKQFPPLPQPLLPDAAPNAPADDEYDKARRSIRLWPVPGTDKNGLWTSSGDFFRDKLDLESRIYDGMIESIERVALPSGPGAKDEVLVRFVRSEDRDMVVGAASKLAACIDDTGKPTAGIRMEVPRRLQSDFKALFRYGQSLRSRHGPGTRKHVKFCDLDRSLYLNVKLPGDEFWSQISTEVARRGLRSRAAATDGELERRMDINGPHLAPPRPRASSSSQAPSGPVRRSPPQRRTESMSS